MVLIRPLERFVVLGVFAIYILLPVVAVVLYAFATRWTTNILPDNYTWAHWRSALADIRLIQVILRTAGLATGVTILVNGLVIPAIYWQWTHNPRIRIHTEMTAMIPFVLPFIVIAFGSLLFSGHVLLSLQGTVWLLVLGHVAIAFPFFHWAVDSAMAAANVPLLNEAAQTCGATSIDTLWRVVLPNIRSGIATGSMLVFATSFNEFALVQILVGNRFETISLYSFDLLTGANADFHKLAVITCLTFVNIFVISGLAVYWDRGNSQSNLFTLNTPTRSQLRS